MNISQEGVDLIKRFEGCKLTAYKPVPTEKFWTIGYGHYGSDVKPNMVISEERAERLLREDLKKYEGYVEKTGLGLNQHQFDALVSFTYNCGYGNLKRLITNRTIEQIGEAIPLYNKAGGKVLNGLVRRRAAEKILFFKGDEE